MINQSLLPEFDQEMAGVRRTLERIPDGKFDWKPHEKSMALGQLANHLAEMAGWVSGTLHEDSFDMAPVDGPAYKSPALKSREEILELFDKNVAEGRAALAAASDEALLGTWTFLSGGKPMFSMPRVGVIRTWVLNHAIHHRAQLGVYLRLNEIPVPSLYGPSADEGSM